MLSMQLKKLQSLNRPSKLDNLKKGCLGSGQPFFMQLYAAHLIFAPHLIFAAWPGHLCFTIHPQ